MPGTRTRRRWPTASATVSVWGMLVACLLPAHGTAQVNIESVRGTDAPQGLSGTVNTTLKLSTGNVKQFQLGVGGRVDFRSGVTSAFLVGRGSLGLLDSTRFSNDGLVHLRGMFGSGWALPEAYVQVNYDEPRRLKFRAVAGAGARLRLADAEAIALWVGSGFMFERELLDPLDSAPQPPGTSVIRSSSYVAARVALGRGATFVATTYAQPKVRDVGDIRVLSEMGLNASISSVLSVTLAFSLRYDSRPPDEVKPLDTELRNGIAVAF